MRLTTQRRRRRNPGAVDRADRALTVIGVPRRHRAVYVAGGLLALGVAAYFGLEAYQRLTFGAKSGEDAPGLVANKVLGKPRVVTTPPAELAAAAAVPLDQYSLARAIQSEAGSSSEAERTAVAWVVWNMANSLGKTITATVTSGNQAGFYGAQNLGGRFVSTASAPRAANLALAGSILAGEIPDNTGGALHFFNPALQDRMLAKLVPGYKKSAAQFIATMRKDGFEPREVEDVDPSKFLVFVKAAGRGEAVA